MHPRFFSSIAITLMLVVLAGCSKVQQMPVSGQAPIAQHDHATANGQLAYEHTVDIDTTPDKVATLYADGLRACREAAAACTLLESRIDSEPDAAASLKFRATPDLIPKLVAAMGDQAELARQSTRVEDLSGPIADTARELAMLDDYRSRLEALRSRAGNDIDALVKVNRELAEIQSKYETADGKRALLARRVDTDILNVSIRSDRRRPFWSPIRRSLGEFGSNLSQGISFAVSGVAYLLPWLFILLVAGWAVRKLWRRRRR